MKLLSIQVGLPKEVQWQGKTTLTSIFKSPIPGPVHVGKTNIDGDQQSDLTVHGGVDKAVYAYSFDAYPWWKSQLAVDDLPNGAFGENLTFEKLDEAAFGVGDRYSLGTCELQVAEPRFPCFKLGIKFGDMGVLRTFMNSRRPGIYFRVLKEGTIKLGDTLTLVAKEPVQVSVADFFQLKVDSYADLGGLKKLLSIPSLSPAWRGSISEKLAEE